MSDMQTNMNVDIQILQQFKKQLISFFDELISQFPEEADLVLIRIFLNDQMPIKDVMDVFIRKINGESSTIREMIKNRNESFFIENNSVFQEISKMKVNHFKKLWMSGRLDAEDKKIVWKWVDSFLYLSDKYVASVGANTIASTH
jgi:hypothetical protein